MHNYIHIVQCSCSILVTNQWGFFLELFSFSFVYFKISELSIVNYNIDVIFFFCYSFFFITKHLDLQTLSSVGRSSLNFR